MWYFIGRILACASSFGAVGGAVMLFLMTVFTNFTNDRQTTSFLQEAWYGIFLGLSYGLLFGLVIGTIIGIIVSVLCLPLYSLTKSIMTTRCAITVICTMGITFTVHKFLYNEYGGNHLSYYLLVLTGALITVLSSWFASQWCVEKLPKSN